MHAVRGGAQEQRLGAGCRMVQTVLGTVGTGSAFVCHEGGNVHGILDLLIAVEAAPVGGDHAVAVEDAHGVERGAAP